MEFQSTNPVDSYKLKLPKCGNERNILDCYKLTDKQLSDEERCIATLTSSEGYLHQERMKNPGNNQLQTKEEALQMLLLSHPFPKHQGPFEKHISEVQYGFGIHEKENENNQYTFNSYTTFLHDDNQSCKHWSINSVQNAGEPKHELTFTITEIKDQLKLQGPASDLNMSIMYNCNKHQCVIMCPCTICERSDNLSPQCPVHHVDLHRKFDENLHSFTIPCSSNKFLPLYKEHFKFGDDYHTGHRYAGIPRSCPQCRLDLLDHQIHHHVLHHFCKFCTIVLMVLEVDEPMDKIRKTHKEILKGEDCTCSFCYKIFTTRGNRIYHERTEHQYVKMIDLKRPGTLHYNSTMYNKSLKLLTCTICICSFDDITKLNHHKLKKHGVANEKMKKPYSCSLCEQSYASAAAVIFHKNTVHKEEARRYICEQCQTKFSCEMTLKRHTISVHQSPEDKLKCNICDSEFRRKDEITRHKKEIHKVANVNHHYSNNQDGNFTIHSIRPYRCPKCFQKFKRKEHLQNHIKIFHIGMDSETAKDVQHSCKKCNKAFSNKKTLNQHEKEVHMNRLYSCERCDMTFQKDSNLKRHQISSHTNINAFRCETCDKSFNRKDSMIRHTKTCSRK